VSRKASALLPVLHGLRVKGLADPAGLALFTGLPVCDLSDLLETLSAAGTVVHRDGMISGWRLTEVGRAEHAAALVAEGQDSRTVAQLRLAFERFPALDQAVKAICTEWQMRDLEAGLVNDHSDATYDAAVVARLRRVHDAVLGVVTELEAANARFGPYGTRLDAACARVSAGNPDALTKPLTGSYHDVWMELHEDLLLTLGLDREDERP